MRKKSIISLVMVVALLIGLAPIYATAATEYYKDFATTPGTLMKIEMTVTSTGHSIYVGAPGKELIWNEAKNTKGMETLASGRSYYIPAGQTVTRVRVVPLNNTGFNVVSMQLNNLLGPMTANHHSISGGATDITANSANVKGIKWGLGVPTTLQIGYSSDPTAFRYGGAGLSLANTYGSYTYASASLTGLYPDTTYYYAVVKSDSSIPGIRLYGDVRSFRTLPVGAPANMITNGSFEQNTPAPGCYNYKISTYGSTSVPGWKAAGNVIEVHSTPVYWDAKEGNFAYAADGSVYAELNVDLCAPVEIYQDFATTPGSELTISFAHKARAIGSNNFVVKMGAPGSEGQVKNVTGSSYAWDYTSFTYKVPAGQTTTRIRFVSLNGNSYSAGNDIDDVKVVCSKMPVNQKVITGIAQNITSVSAQIVNNSYENIASGDIYWLGVRYSTSPSLAFFQETQQPSGTPFNAAMAGLTPNTKYYYQAYVYSKTGLTFGEIKTFTTLSPTIPKVNTGIAQGTTATSTQIINNSYENIVAGDIYWLGVRYSTSPSLAFFQETQQPAGTPFNASLAGLTPDTTYYYQAYVYSKAGFTFGEVKTFTTLADNKKISVDGTVVWVDMNNARLTRPATFTVNLYQNGTFLKSMNVDPSGNGLFSFADLPEKDGAGNLYIYTVGGANAVTGYDTRVSGTTITNSLKRLYLTTIYFNVLTNSEISRDSALVLYGDVAATSAKTIPGYNLLSGQSVITFPRMERDETVIFYYLPI